MRRSATQTMSGVTLLEILLVLAVAATVIILSIRYYQSATQSQQSNALLDQVQAITSAMDNLSQGSNGSYASITTAQITSVAGNALTTPWGGTITISGQSTTTYAVSIPVPVAAVCTALAVKLQASTKFTSPTCTGGNVTYTYNSTT